MDTRKIISDIRGKIEPYSNLDDGDEYGEYVSWLMDLDSRWDMMSPDMLKAYIAELREVLDQYTENYEIVEVTNTHVSKSRELRYKGE